MAVNPLYLCKKLIHSAAEFLFLLFVPLCPLFLNIPILIHIKARILTVIIIIVAVITFFPGGSALFSQADVYGPEMCADLSSARTVKSHTDTRRILGSRRSSEAEAASDPKRRADGRGTERKKGEVAGGGSSSSPAVSQRHIGSAAPDK